MKTFHIIGSVLLVLGLGLFFGCDSGSSDGSGATSTSAELDTQNVNNFAKKISNEMGCTYTELTESTAATLRGMLPLQMVSIVANATDIKGKLTEDHTLSLRALRDVETTSGDCGGQMITTSNESTGSISYVFDNYCNGELTGANTVINGAVDMTVAQGSNAMVINASTTQPIRVTTVNPETNENVDVTLGLTGGKVTVNTVNGELTLDENLNVSLSASSGYITDNTTGEKYSGSNLSAQVANGVTQFSATYTDPDLGTVTVSGTGNQDGTATINVAGSGGTNAQFNETAAEGVFSVTTNGTASGTMDCSMVDTSSIDIPSL